MLKLIKKMPAWVLWVMPLVLVGLAVYLATIQRFGACCVLFFLFGVFGTSAASRFDSDSGRSMTRQTSLIETLGASWPKVTMWATCSVPYLRVTHSSTLSRPTSSKSMSTNWN